jgi:hypothetical protein
MTRSVRASIAALGLVALGAVVAFPHSVGLDYGADAGPAIAALARGDLPGFFANQPFMGSFSILLGAPFVALDPRGGDDVVYALGALPCLLVLAAFTLRLARYARGQGRPAGQLATVVGLCLVGPATLQAVHFGHPEELLGAVLCVAAVLAAERDRPGAAGVALGLALATKQWAAFAVLPVLLAAPGRQGRLALVAGGVAAALTVPLILGDFGRFHGVAGSVVAIHPNVTPASAWWPFHLNMNLHQPFAGFTESWQGPDWLGRIGHPAVALATFALALAFSRRRRGGGREDALALLALVMLARCVLDPLDNVYYHLPFLLALLTWELRRRDGWPRLTLVASAGLVFLTFATTHLAAQGALVNALYLAWTLPIAGALGVVLFAPGARLARRAEPGLAGR